jgi:membrane-bound ClpP family serine protease
MKWKGYTVSTVVTTLLGAAAIVGVVLWVLPRWGINIPLGGFILLMAAYVAYQVITYRLGRRALDRKPVVAPEAMVGCSGRAATPLTPDGYVRVQGELWRAISVGPDIEEGKDVEVVEVNRLTLLVSTVEGNHKG